MLKKLIEFIKNNHPNSNVDDYLDAKYIQITNPQLKEIAQVMQNSKLSEKPASSCSADNFIFHFGNTLIFLQKDTSNSSIAYQAEMAWETDFLAVHSTRNKGKGFYFIGFEFDDDYKTKLKKTDKMLEDQVRNEEQNHTVIKKIMPVLKGFMQAISD